MLKAIEKTSGKLISIDEFLSKYGVKAIESSDINLVCPVCDGRVYLYGVASMNVTKSFNHYPGTSCESETSPNSWLSIPNDWNIENGIRVRAKLLDKIFISKLYCFCLKLCGHTNLSIDRFCDLIKAADKRNLWRTAGLEEWVIGFLLLVLDDFEAIQTQKDSAGGDKKYTFRFILKQMQDATHPQITHIKPTREKVRIEDIWETDSYYLFKLFASGKLMNLSKDNPYQVNHETWLKFSKEFEWFLEHHGDTLIAKVFKLKQNREQK